MHTVDSKYMFNTNFANGWIQTADLWRSKRPRYQLSHWPVLNKTYKSAEIKKWLPRCRIIFVNLDSGSGARVELLPHDRFVLGSNRFRIGKWTNELWRWKSVFHYSLCHQILKTAELQSLECCYSYSVCETISAPSINLPTLQTNTIHELNKNNSSHS